MEPPASADDCIFFHFAKADQIATRFWAKRISALGVTPVQGLVLNVLGEDDRITSGDLGRRVMLDSATLSGVLDRLEGAGLIVRDRHPDDRRAVLLCLTSPGRRLASRLFQCMQEANQAFLAEHFSEEERTILQMLLRKLRRVG
ncbi:MAG: MarR family transcriptional regulator [Pseudomonadota bacterium]